MIPCRARFRRSGDVYALFPEKAPRGACGRPADRLVQCQAKLFLRASGPAARIRRTSTPASRTPPRVYDCWLGGTENFAADRAAGDEAIGAFPGIVAAVRANRAFLARAVGYMAAAGVRQFLDIGTGIPTAGNIHEVAQRAAADARIVYR